jgi:hypothetical protein
MKVIKDCFEHVRTGTDPDVGDEPERAGHDFWLTGNGHGHGRPLTWART